MVRFEGKTFFFVSRIAFTKLDQAPPRQNIETVYKTVDDIARTNVSVILINVHKYHTFLSIINHIIISESLVITVSWKQTDDS